MKLVAEEGSERELSDHEHLPGYLPDGDEQNRTQTTVATMLIPLEKLPFIKRTFGNKIDEGEGCFLECLYDTVELHFDARRDDLRLAVPRWQLLEELNVRQVSHKYFEE